LISKYTYLLDFLDERYWLDQIIQVALKRRDLELEGKSAIMATLEDAGIDVTVPPFSVLLGQGGGPLAETFPRLMDKGEEGLLWFVEDFTYLPREIQLSLLTELSRVPDPRVVNVLEILLWFDDREVVPQVITALGRVRRSEAALLLEEVRQDLEPCHAPLVAKSLRRLAFVGISSERAKRRPRRLPFHSAYASPVDGAGYRLLTIARWREEGRLDTLNLQLHDVTGIKGAWGDSAEPVAAYEERSAARSNEELVEQITPGYALQLLADALQRSRDEGFLAPPEFYVRRNMFAPHEIRPSRYEPPCGKWPITVTPRLLTATAQLLEEEFFAGWYLATCRVYDLAEEWMQLEQTAAADKLTSEVEKLIERFCSDEIKPNLQQLAHRLVMNADFLSRIGVDGELVKTTLAAAASLHNFQLPCHLHPFIRRFALESLLAAREALAEGYDLRDHPEDEDEDWV
jgi:hypothetical protein